jgi:ParB/RepB/Spo0J family partition protein
MKKQKANPVAETAPQPSAVEIKHIPYALIRPDPNQPRKTFSEAALKEIADSIREQGILQPLIVEHLPARFKLQAPDLHSDNWHVLERMSDGKWEDVFQDKSEERCRNIYTGEEGLKDAYQIVAGERRWRGAGIVGLSELPCVIRRDLTEKQRFAIQFIENSQRENVTALEEAEALKQQLAKRKETDPSFKPEDLAAELGQSVSKFYETLKLTRLHPPIREALLAGKISVSVAGVVAMIPLPNQQEKLLKHITNENNYHYPFSVRDVREIVDEEYVKQLSEAPFNKEVDYLTDKGARLPACVDCPHRSGNMVAEFPDLKNRPHVCTKPDCFAQKCKMHWLDKADHLRSTGKTVMTTAEFKKVSKEYVDAERTGWGVFDNEYDSPAKVLGKHAPEPTLVATPEGMKKYFKREDLAEAAKKAKVKLATSRKSETPEEKADREAKEKERNELIGRRRQLVLGLVRQAAAGLAKIKDAVAWKLLASMLDEDPYFYSEFDKALWKLVKGDRARVLAAELGKHLRSPVDNTTGDWDKDCLSWWKELGVDLVAEEAKAAPALPLAKAEPKQGKLLDVKKNKKKGAKK